MLHRLLKFNDTCFEVTFIQCSRERLGWCDDLATARAAEISIDGQEPEWHTCSSCNIDLLTSESIRMSCISCISSPTGCRSFVSELLSKLNNSKAVSDDCA